MIGNSEKGLIHAFFELYDANATGRLLSCISKVAMAFMQMHGFTCGVSDLILNEEANKQRKEFIEQAHKRAVQHIGKHLGLKDKAFEDSVVLNNRPSYHRDERIQVFLSKSH